MKVEEHNNVGRESIIYGGAALCAGARACERNVAEYRNKYLTLLNNISHLKSRSLSEGFMQTLFRLQQ